MWETIIYTLVSAFVLYLSPLRITNFPACLFRHLGTYKLKCLLWEQSSLALKIRSWVYVLLWLKLETMNAWGFFKSAIEQRRLDCSFADFLDVSYWFALCSMLIFTLEKACGEFCKFSVQNSTPSTAAIPRHFQWNWGRRPALTFSRGGP